MRHASVLLRGALVFVSVAVACSSPERSEAPREVVGKTASALTTARYEAETMTWSGTEGVHGEVRTDPAPTHRYFWTDGHVAQTHTFVGGSTTITVRAQGELLAGVGPHLVVTVGGVQIGDATVNETAWTSKTFTFQAAPGPQELRVTYDNDDASAQEDRNVLLDWVEIDEPTSPPPCTDTTYEAESMSWSGTEGVNGEVRTYPPPTHRYFWTNGHIWQSHPFTAGPMRVRVRAMGELLGGVGPRMRVSVGGVEIGSVTLDETSYVDKTFELTATDGAQEIRVTYDNDDWISPGGPGNDRNLLVDRVEVLCGSGTDGGTTDDGGQEGGTSCSPETCTSSDPCTTAECTTTGCVQTPVADGTVCGGTTCTGLSVCQAGTCVTGSPPVLQDGLCTYEICDEQQGVVVLPKPVGTSCSNGNACDGAETCDGAGACAPGAPPTLDDGNPCTVDACDPATGVTHTPAAAGTSCSNGNACDGLEVCDGAGACVPGAAPALDDGNVCTADACDPVLGVTHTPIPTCDPTPVGGSSPFESRASLLGRVISKTGSPVTDATFVVYDEHATGMPRTDVTASVASDGSFRLRLTAFPESEPERSPPHRLVVKIDSPGTIRATREAYVHVGDSVDLGTIKLVPRDPLVTPIGPAGGTATDSQGLVEVVIPPGALATTVPIQITPFTARDEFPAPLPDDTLTMYGFELEPHGTTFAAPVTLRATNYRNIPTSLAIPSGVYDDVEGRWDHDGIATWDGARFSTQVTHFCTRDLNPQELADLVIQITKSPKANGGAGVCGTGSTWHPTGGSIEQTFPLPTTHVRGEDFGLTLTYDSGLAGSRQLGAPPAEQYAAVPQASLAMPVGSVSVRSFCVSGGSGAPASSPGQCTAVISGGCGMGGVTIDGQIALAGAQLRAIRHMTEQRDQLEIGGWLHVPVAGDELPLPGLVTGQVTLASAGGGGACVASGNTFAVSDPLAPRVQIEAGAERGEWMRVQRKMLFHHRFNSPFGSGWAVREVSRAYVSGDFASIVHGDGHEEDFRPRPQVEPLPDGLTGEHAFARDPVTGEVFLASLPGTISRVDLATGARTVVLGGLALGSTNLSLHDMAVAYVGGVRHFVVALATPLVDIDGSGNQRQLALRTTFGNTHFNQARVAARGDLVFYTDGDNTTPLLHRLRLSDPAPTLQAMSATTGDRSLYPKAPLSGVQFDGPRGLAFGLDGKLYVAEPRRHAVYELTPQADGEVGPASAVTIALGRGAARYLPEPGERYAGRAFSVNQPTGLDVAEDGTLLVQASWGISAYDPLSREAEILFLDNERDELTPSLAGVSGVLPARPASFVALSRNSLLSTSYNHGLLRVDVDPLSSLEDPTRTMHRLTGGAVELVDTTAALVWRYDATGRLVERRKRTGEIEFQVLYKDAKGNAIDRIVDAIGGETVFAYSNDKLSSITDARGRVTQVTVDAFGDLIQIREPDGELHAFTYDKHHLTAKTSPRGEVTTYTYAANGTVETSSKPGGESYSFQAVLSSDPTYDENDRLVHAGSYTDARGVQHTLRVNAFSQIERDDYVAAGAPRLVEAVYATDLFGTDEPLAARRKNAPLRVSHHTLNGVPLSPPVQLDSSGRPVRQQRIGGSGIGGTDVHRWEYDANGWLVEEFMGPSNYAQRIERDGAGHVTRIFDVTPRTGGSGATGRQATFTWRTDGQLATSTVHGVTTTFTYDDVGGTRNLLGWTDTLGRSQAMTYDARGNVASMSDGTASASFVHDANNRLIEIRDGLSNLTTLRYAHESCGCSERDLVTAVHTPDLPVGVDWTMTYGPQGRLATVTDPHGFTEEYAYEPTGELKTVKDRNGRTTTMAHDQLGRLLSMVDALGRKHDRSYSLPQAGSWSGPSLAAASADATPATTSLGTGLRSGDYQIGLNALDVEGYPARISFYRDATFELAYTHFFDNAGRPTKRLDRVGTSIASATLPAFSTTGEHADEAVSWHPSTSAAIVRSFESRQSASSYEGATIQRDLELDATQADGFWGAGDPRALELFTRDTAGRITERRRRFFAGTATPPDMVSTYVYRPDGRLESLTNPDGAHAFTYDARGLLATQTTAEGTYVYGYDEVGRNVTLEYPDGHVRRQLFDDVGRITSRCYEYPADPLSNRCYGAVYDAVGNPVRLTDPEGADVVVVDALDRISTVTREVGGVPVSVETYAYNALGALALNAGVPLAAERPRLDGAGTAAAAVPASLDGAPIPLDPAGRVTALGGATLTWSRMGLVRDVAEPIPAAPLSYGVDTSLRRFARVRGAAVEMFVFEGADRVATIDPAGTVLESVLFGGTDHPLRLRRSDGTLAYFELDLAGNVRRLRAPGGPDLGGDVPVAAEI